MKTATAEQPVAVGPTRGRTRIQSLARGCQLLLWLAERPLGATAKQVAFGNRIALATTYHLLNTLVDEGLLTKDSQRRYRLGSRSAVLAQAYLRGSAVSQCLLTALRALAERTKETVYLADWGEYDIRVLASVEGTEVVRVAEVASSPYEDGHARANGKVLLAFAWPEIRENYLECHALRRLTARTICDPEALERELEGIRKRGYAIDDEEFGDGVSCVAAPLLVENQLIASFGVSVPTARFHARRAQLTAALLDVVGGVARDFVPAPGAGPDQVVQQRPMGGSA